ncbi:hypothetical protein [Pseudomonas lopnurensis]|uniref:hypothetical protein n=1 Tax=Pseudomonas lopnurensis TaxID=1477517 RepID=UPI0028AABDA0|nr:hypothetical protein [Pseudomonas lopnurensis]
MTRSTSSVIPFPKRVDPHTSLDASACYFQVAAELRVMMLHRLFSMLTRSQASTPDEQYLHETCRHARELLNDVVVLYRSSLAQTTGRGEDE